MNFVEELRWRGMLHDIMPETEEYLLKNKTKKRGGGLFNLLGTASRVSVGIRNIKYIKTLENRLVNTHNDYDWVQARRAKNIMPPLNKYEYTDNDWTSDK